PRCSPPCSCPRASSGSEWRARSRLATAAAPRLPASGSASVRAFLGSRWRLVAAEVDREVRGWKRGGDHAPTSIELAIATAGNERASRAVHILWAASRCSLRPSSGRGVFKAAALLGAFVLIIGVWFWDASVLTVAADENL